MNSDLQYEIQHIHYPENVCGHLIFPWHLSSNGSSYLHDEYDKNIYSSGRNLFLHEVFSFWESLCFIIYFSSHKLCWIILNLNITRCSWFLWVFIYFQFFQIFAYINTVLLLTHTMLCQLTFLDIMAHHQMFTFSKNLNILQ